MKREPLPPGSVDQAKGAGHLAGYQTLGSQKRFRINRSDTSEALVRTYSRTISKPIAAPSKVRRVNLGSEFCTITFALRSMSGLRQSTIGNYVHGCVTTKSSRSRSSPDFGSVHGGPGG